jgi:hypothetical protein
MSHQISKTFDNILTVDVEDSKVIYKCYRSEWKHYIDYMRCCEFFPWKKCEKQFLQKCTKIEKKQ